jgi:hypothetical protein
VGGLSSIGDDDEALVGGAFGAAEAVIEFTA